MMPAILWKEYREHRMVWVVLAIISPPRSCGYPWRSVRVGSGKRLTAA